MAEKWWDKAKDVVKTQKATPEQITEGVQKK